MAPASLHLATSSNSTFDRDVITRFGDGLGVRLRLPTFGKQVSKTSTTITLNTRTTFPTGVHLYRGGKDAMTSWPKRTPSIIPYVNCSRLFRPGMALDRRGCARK